MSETEEKIRAPRNRTVSVSRQEHSAFRAKLYCVQEQACIENLENKTINQDLFEVLDWLPPSSIDLLFLDPPYNLTKSFNGNTFRERSLEEYRRWFESWFQPLLRTLKRSASVYICADWRSSSAIDLVVGKYLVIRNRITWEREKGRGAIANWKNCSEDVWFCTVSDEYTFNVDAVKLKRRVIAPYTTPDGEPKDWEKSEDGNYRLTCPSNLWTDLTVPFWSMQENTDHPTQKPEKLLARIILASSKPGDVVLDPFLGSGTTSVVAKKLGRRYVGIEIDEKYCCLAEKRLATAEQDKTIQGYFDGVFWERNTLQDQKGISKGTGARGSLPLFAPDPPKGRE